MRLPAELSSLGEPISRHSVGLKGTLNLVIFTFAIVGVASIVGDSGSVRARVAGATLSREASQGVFFASGVVLLIVAVGIAAMTWKAPRSLIVVVAERGLGTLRKGWGSSTLTIYTWNDIERLSLEDDGCVVRRRDGREEHLPAALPRYEALVRVLADGVKLGHAGPEAAAHLAGPSPLQPLAFVLVIALGLFGVAYPILMAGAAAVAIAVTALRSKHRIDKNIVLALWSIFAVFLLLGIVVWMR